MSEPIQGPYYLIPEKEPAKPFSISNSKTGGPVWIAEMLGGLNDDVIEANGRLLASSFEMLLALREIELLSGPTAIKRARKIAREAIEKATGEAK